MDTHQSTMEKTETVTGETASADGTSIDISTSIEVDVIKPKPRIGLVGAVAFGLGCIIGSGIFVSPKGALQNTNSIGMSLIAWIISGGITIIVGLVYAELGTLVPKSGGDYTYINEGIGYLPAFLTAWIMPMFTKTATLAVLSLVFADYLCAPIFGTCTPPDSIRKTIAATMLLSIGITNVISVKFAAFTQMFFTAAKLTAVFIIIVGGIVFLAQGRTENLHDSFEGSSTNVASYTLAIYSCMFAYSGSQHINEITEELINPKKNIPRAAIISILSVMTIYVLINLSYFILLSKPEFLQSSAVAYDWGLKGIPPAAVIMPLSVMCSVYGTANGNSFTSGRVMFAAAREGHLPEVLSFLHMRTLIPTSSIVLIHIIATVLIIPSDISMLINLATFLTFVIILLTTISLLRLRYQRRQQERFLKIPIFVPVLSLFICVFMIVSPFTSDPPIELLYGAGLIVLGIILYIPFVHFKLSVPGTDYLTTKIQLLMQTCPTEEFKST